MAGLLKQLQKRKSRLGSSVSDVLITPESESRYRPQTNPDSPSFIDGEFMSPERLLQELMAGGKAEAVAPAPVKSRADADPGASKSLIVRRHRKSEDGDTTSRKQDSLPAWLSERRRTSPLLDLLIPAAAQALLEPISESQTDADVAASIEQALQTAIKDLAGEHRISRWDQEQALRELLGLALGRGPLQFLFDDESVTDIFVDNHKSIKVLRRGQTIETPFSFRGPADYRLFVAGLTKAADRKLNASSPIIDCILNDQWHSRLNAVDPSIISGDEPKLCIRIPRLQQISFYDVLQSKVLPATLAAWLTELVISREVNILVVGPTGSGKTLMTTALLSAVGSDERVITIEDVPEISIATSNLEKLVARPANALGEGGVNTAELLQTALRRAPHRIAVGSIHDEEGRVFLRALESGYLGSIGTIHANSSSDGLWRLLDIVAAYEHVPQESLIRRIARSIHLVISMRKVDERPCLAEIAEIEPLRTGDFSLRPLVAFAGVFDGKRKWKLFSGASRLLERMRERGADLRPGPALLPADEETPAGPP